VKALLRLGSEIPQDEVLKLMSDDDFVINLATVCTVGIVKRHWNMVHESKDNFCGFAKREYYEQLYSFPRQWALKSFDTTKDKMVHIYERMQRILRKADRENLPYDKAYAQKEMSEMREYIDSL
jgi:hypothetical protein